MQSQENSSLIQFLKDNNYTSEYHETWEVQINILEWETNNEESKIAHPNIRFAFWESGSSFLKKFSLYNEPMLRGASILLYVFSFVQISKTDQIELLVDKTRKSYKDANKVEEGGNPKPIEIILFTHDDLSFTSIISKEEI